MTVNGDREPARWRVRWAERENERRRRAHAEALARWRTDEAELRAMLDTARSPRGIPHDRVIAPIRLRRDETVLWQSRRAGLIEPPSGTPVRDLGFDGFSLRTVRPGGAAPPQARDHGVAIVTDRRVIFRGERVNREWDHRQLTRFAHDPKTPVTLIHVSNRKRTSGLAPPHAEAGGFRFAFTLGVSISLGRREGFAAHLENMLAGLGAQFPAPPPVARPEEARWGFWRSVYIGRPSMPIWLRAMQFLAAVFVSLFLALAVIGSFMPAQPGPPAAEASPTTPAVAAPTDTASSTPAAKRTATPTVRPSAKPTPKPKPPKPKPTPSRTRRPSPKPEPKNLCGAPDNPYGYNFCGGSYIHDPKPGTCVYFDCIDYFDEGKGYMIQCNDGDYSLSGGRQGACSHHDGVRRPVYR